MSEILECISETDSQKLYQAKHIVNFLADISDHKTDRLSITNESFYIVMNLLREKLEIDTQPLKVQN